jgi:O-succinylbenzoate synthase
MFKDLLPTMRVIALPMKTNFRGVTVREVALFQGEYGWGEFSPFLEYDEEESARWLACAIEAATEPRPAQLRSSIAVNGTIPAINDKDVIERLVESYPGVNTFKVKVGDNLPEDIARLARVRTLRPKAKLRVDVNGNWSVKDAITNLRTIFENIGPLEYAEQPCATVEELRELKEKLKVDIPIAGDEVLRKAADPFEVNLTGAIDVLMLKVQPLGGIKNSLALAAHHKLPVVVSSALESAIGINYGLELAAAIENLTLDCGLATGSLMSADVAQLQINNGAIALGDLDIKLDGLDVAPDRFEWWKNRAMRCAEVLGL